MDFFKEFCFKVILEFGKKKNYFDNKYKYNWSNKSIIVIVIIK